MKPLEAGRIGSLFWSLSASEQAILKGAFHSILAGKPASLEKLAAEARVTVEQAAEIVKSLADQGTVVCNAPGNIVGSWGLSLHPTPHRLRMKERDLYTWCAEDAVGIPAAFQEDATIASACFRCGQPIRVEMRAGTVRFASPPRIHIWLSEVTVGRSIVDCT